MMSYHVYLVMRNKRRRLLFCPSVPVYRERGASLNGMSRYGSAAAPQLHSYCVGPSRVCGLLVPRAKLSCVNSVYGHVYQTTPNAIVQLHVNIVMSIIRFMLAFWPDNVLQKDIAHAACAACWPTYNNSEVTLLRHRVWCVFICVTWLRRNTPVHVLMIHPSRQHPPHILLYIEHIYRSGFCKSYYRHGRDIKSPGPANLGIKVDIRKSRLRRFTQKGRPLNLDTYYINICNQCVDDPSMQT